MMDGEILRLDDISSLFSFDTFEKFLMQPGPWIAGIDFPFGQPRKLIDNIRWPKTWEGYVRHVAGMSKDEFVALLGEYRQGRKKGDKQHLRYTDELANSRSPMMLYGVPVGKMFYEGAPRLLRSGACIQPCRPIDDPRIIVEAYPALVARRWSEGQSYKSDDKQKQTADRETAREGILYGLRTDARSHFGFDLQISDDWLKRCIRDGSGDQLDALLCAAQASWAYSHRDRSYGIALDCGLEEGWIVDHF